MKVGKKPTQVTIANNNLVASFKDSSTYPLMEAVDGAFDEFVECRSKQDAIKFTEKWGFLFDPGQSSDSFPLEYFYFWKECLLTLSRVAFALRARTGLIQAVWQWKALPLESKYMGPELFKSRGKKNWQKLLEKWHREEEKGWLKSTPSGYASHLLANRLNIPCHLVPVRFTDRWELLEIPDIHSLQDAMLWTLRQRLTSIEYRICEGCQKGFVVKRRDQRFCSHNCGIKIRMRRMREKKKPKQPGGGRMGKYDPLGKRLEQQTGQSLTLGFEEIEEIIGVVLPDSARTHSAWWSNEDPEQTRHVQCKSWGIAGWEVKSVDLLAGTVRFVRR